jgi:hypothetical protein
MIAQEGWFRALKELLNHVLSVVDAVLVNLQLFK